ncbi:PAS domain-containing protein [Haloprofundus salinisoli]|uniref:PAS domain-containing protein n=1 Tax=Haloprofundus salinisoli TaxID=2876193 RepID=UPI001CCA9F8C|nr:PAS domain-containing protein [Haloprofundus salinisoli]
MSAGTSTRDTVEGVVDDCFDDSDLYRTVRLWNADDAGVTPRTPVDDTVYGALELTTDRSTAFDADPERATAVVPLDVCTSSIHGDDRHRVEDSITAAVESGSEWKLEYRVKTNADELHWVDARRKLKYDETGTPLDFPRVVIGSTERKRAEEKLRRARDKLETRRGGRIWAESDDGGPTFRFPIPTTRRDIYE